MGHKVEAIGSRVVSGFLSHGIARDQGAWDSKPKGTELQGTTIKSLISWGVE